MYSNERERKKVQKDHAGRMQIPGIIVACNREREKEEQEMVNAVEPLRWCDGGS
jgi:hypothetical protein